MEPDDDTLRLVYADWLDEHDDPARAEFIRIQIEAESHETGSPEHEHLTDRAVGLLSANGNQWATGYEPLTEHSVSRTVTRAHYCTERGIALSNLWFYRGFVDSIHCRPETFFSTDPTNLRPEGPLPRVCLKVGHREGDPFGAIESYVGRLASSPVLCRLRDIRIHGGFESTTDDGLRLLANEPGLLAKLGGLLLSEDRISDEGILPILESPTLTGLCELAIDNTPCTGAVVQALLRSDSFRGMTYLHLDGIIEGACGLRPFASPGRWPRLRWLGLGNCGLDDLTLRGLMRPGAFPALEVLNLSFSEVHLHALRALLSSGVFPKLRLLGIGGTPLTLDEVASLRAEFGHRVDIGFPVPRSFDPSVDLIFNNPAIRLSSKDG
ncbi:MAG: TIGR02996 domain-containing protein [Gemmataceae bacterium]|nr:TIGR02996 domain-containing protein [Gemmataceae bacterium]